MFIVYRLLPIDLQLLPVLCTLALSRQCTVKFLYFVYRLLPIDCNFLPVLCTHASMCMLSSLSLYTPLQCSVNGVELQLLFLQKLLFTFCRCAKALSQ